MTFELEWRDSEEAPGRWRDFAHADDLKSFVVGEADRPSPLNGEFRIRLRNGLKEVWTVVTTTTAIARWQPPAAPEPLLASVWTVKSAVAANHPRHAQRVRACLEAARDDGLLHPRQVDELVEIFDQAVAGEGPAGRHTDPISARPDDIRQALGPIA